MGGSPQLCSPRLRAHGDTLELAKSLCSAVPQTPKPRSWQSTAARSPPGGGLRAGEATDSGVGSPHAASNRGIFVCTAAVTFLRRAAAQVHPLQELGWGEGAPAAPHRCCSPQGCWAGGCPSLLVALACATPEGATPILYPAGPPGGVTSPGPALGCCTAPEAEPGLSAAACVPQFPHPDGAQAATRGSSLLGTRGSRCAESARDDVKTTQKTKLLSARTSQRGHRPRVEGEEMTEG